MSSIINLQNVTYNYRLDADNEITALRNISLDIEEGSFVALCGENGSGKSTLAKLFNGLLVPSEGEVKVFGISTLTDNEQDIFDIRSKVGMVFQNPDNQMVASIIEDDIAFGPENLGVPREEIEERVIFALSAVDMLEHRTHTPFKLSGGQKQRVAIAAVLAMKPKVLVLDESTAMLDPKGRKEVMEVVHSLNKREGITIILITHYMEECSLADRLVVMQDGSITMDGTPAEVFSRYDKVKANKLELPMVDYIAEKLRQSGLDLPKEIYTEQKLAEALCPLL